ncbi:MAG TPA: HGGxSTG domain-containing protein [Blastocatellia bacterium]|nr:HGGxSTG domain-containing protein [Blastocatellia bacterium]
MDPQFPSCRRKQIQLWSEMAMATHRRNTEPMLTSPRCGATTRSGKACMSPAVSGKRRCRMHGGAAGSGAPRGNKNAVTHGFYSRKAKAERQNIRSLVRHSRDLIRKVR